MKKKFLAVLLACALAVGTAVSPIGIETVKAEIGDEGVTESGLGYREIGKGIEITGYTRGNVAELIIPDTIDGKIVMSIGDGAFSNRGRLTSVNIPSGVVSIGENAFGNCGLTSVNIPSGVTSIGSFAFRGCSSLTSVNIPESVTNIGADAFQDTPWLEEQFDQSEGLAIVNHIVIDADTSISGNVDIPTGVTSIGEMAFRQCSSLTSVNIPSGVTSIGYYAFWACSSLTSVNIPESVTSIGAKAFNGTLWLEEQFDQSEGLAIVNHIVIDADISISGNVDIPTGVTSIGDEAFRECFSLTSVSIPIGVTSIGDNAFRYCSLTSVNIPSGVTSIGFGAFSGCSSLSSVNIPESVTSIGSSPFLDTPWLEEQLKQSEGLVIVNHIVIGADASISGNVDIPTGVTSIGGGAFRECFSLTSVSIPTGVTSIGVGAFTGCHSLTSVNIPESVKMIGGSAFLNCDSLKDVYYAGSQEQWEKIKIMLNWYSRPLLKAVVHYGSSGPGNAGTEISKKTVQTITATDITKTYGEPLFSLGAKSSGDGALSYLVSDTKVAAVDAGGNVTIKGCGITSITITAAETSAYSTAQKTITLTVKPKKMTLSSAKSKKKKTAVVKWKKDAAASGYIIECALDSKFKKNTVRTDIKKNKTVSTTVKKLKPGKKYFVRICAYAKSGNTKVQGDWSKTKTVKVKK